MDIEIDLLMDHLEEEMMNAEEAMKRDFAAVRTGKASPGLVEGLNIDYYGTSTRLKELAGIYCTRASHAGYSALGCFSSRCY